MFHPPQQAAAADPRTGYDDNGNLLRPRGRKHSSQEERLSIQEANSDQQPIGYGRQPCGGGYRILRKKIGGE